MRVKEGGHDIPSNFIERRYIRGIYNLFSIYLPIVDQAILFDNSDGEYDLIAEKTESEALKIVNLQKFNELKHHYE